MHVVAGAGDLPGPGCGSGRVLQGDEQDSPADDSVAEQKQKQRAVASESRIALAREHPAVRAAVEVLGGEIEDVRDLGEE